VARVKSFARMTSPEVLATFSPDDVARVKAAMAPLVQAQATAERLAMRLQGAKADMLDAEDAFRAVFWPLCAAHGLDPNAPLRLNDDGTVVRDEAKK
jgi:hypothetical protein